jgi:hypothetical protein
MIWVAILSFDGYIAQLARVIENHEREAQKNPQKL